MKQLLTIAIAALLFSCNNGTTEKKEDNTKGTGTAASSGATIYSGGKILTMEGDKPEYAEAVVVKDGKIAFVGSKADAEKNAGSGATMAVIS